MWFTRLSIDRPVFVVVFMLTVLVLGLRSLTSMNVDLNPPVNFPYVSITTIYAGTAPEEMETLVTKPVEDAVSDVTGIQHITSSSQYGRSTVSIQFDLGTNPDTAENQVREKVDAARAKMPQDVLPPTVSRIDISDQPVLTMGMSTDLPLKQARYQADKTIEPLISQVSGVARVDITGGDTREIEIQVDRSRLPAYGLSITDIVNAVGSANINVAAGHITEGTYDIDARVIGEFQNVDQIRNLRISVPSKDPANPMYINLRDVAAVVDTVAERSDIARIWFRDKSGKLKPSESVGIVVTKNNDANTIQVVTGVKTALARLEKMLPGNTHFVLNLDQSKTVADQLNDIVVALVAGSILAVLVVFLFLHDIRGTIICAVAIPLCLIATLIPMYFAGFTLNSMTMLALSLVVGILVDDSIVVLENIHRHLSRGELPSEAAYNGRAEIGMAAVSITLVDVAVFLPMAWMGGIVGQFFRQFGLTVACATLFSLVVSFSVTPMLASRLYRSSADVDHVEGSIASRFERFFGSLDDRYHHVLGWCLRSFGRRLLIFVGGWVALFATAIILGPRLGFQFTPVTDQGQITVTCELSTGASLDSTNRVTRAIEARLATIPEVDTIFTSVGSISGGSMNIPQLGPQYAQVNVNLIDKPGSLDSMNPFYHGTARKRADVVIADEMRKKVADIPGAKIVVIPVSGFGGSQAPVDMELLGLNLSHMQDVALQFKARLKTVPGVMDPDISLRPGKPEAEVIVDRTKAALYGYSVAQIANVVRTAFSGNNDSKYREQGDEYDIRVELRDLDRSSTAQMGSLIVGTRGTNGHYEPVYLNDVASIVMGSGPTQLDRLDRQRVVHVTAYLTPGHALGNMQGVINKAIGTIPLGNIRLVWGGQAEQMGTEMGYLIGSLFLSIILVYLLMAALFDNLLYPLVIQFSVPMALIGALIAMVIMGKALSIIAMIGVIMLVGLVQKNAILLIDYTNTLRARGIERNMAIQQAGATRLRPILMTTIAMVFGMMPVALGIGRSSEARSPLAVCVIGGLIVSTVLTLVMIPITYTLFDTVMVRVGRLFGRNHVDTRTRIRRKPTGRDLEA